MGTPGGTKDAVERRADRDGAGWWWAVAAAVPVGVLAFALTTYADEAGRDVSWDPCHPVGPPGSIVAAAIGAPVLSLVATVATVRAAVVSERRPGLRLSAVVVAGIVGFLGLLETIAVVGVLGQDGTCPR
ncbi:hypothetical protein [Kitasatospora sp. NPDC048538]|uniref:hypothetical protein n=1 Tax=unclassified Kitasatospora TaxID=2633591 RepID=UPI0033D35695